MSDASGGPIRGARAFLDKFPERTVITEADGTFKICAPRSAQLRVEAHGYGPWQKSLHARGAERQDVTLTPEASLAGTVVSAERGEPIPWAIVNITSDGNAVSDLRADAAGRFEAHVAPGGYAVSARAKHAHSKAPVECAVFASSKSDVVVPLEARASVRGRVVSRRGPVRRANVNLGFAATLEWGTRTTTSDDGSFAIDDVPVGNVLVQVDDHDVETPRTLRVPETGAAAVEIMVAPKAEIRVIVTRGSKAVSDATVYLRSMHMSDSRATNAAGIATFRGLPETTFRIVAEHENDFAVKEATVVARGATADVSLDLGAGRQIEGRVVDEHGRPVDGARIAFVPASSTESGGASAVTTEDGTFHGGPLRGPATYRVTITRSGFPLDMKNESKTGTRIVVPESGPPSPTPLVLVVKARDKGLRGAVVDAAGGPVADARVVVTGPDRHSSTLATTFTGNDGAFAFHALGEGPYTLKASAASGAAVEKRLTLPSVPVRLELPPVGSIHGTVRGFSRVPSVMAWGIAGYDWDFHPAVIESGRFAIEGLSRGRYHIAATTPETAAHATVDIVDEKPVDVELVASGTRIVRGNVRDFIAGGPLPNMTCQVAPYVTDTRSPVVVPGTFFSDAEGAFELSSAPASDLYMWCSSGGNVRGGVARLPADLGDRRATVWGLDVRNRPATDPGTLGFGLADDHPFSRRVARIDAKTAAERAGLAFGDVIENVGDRSVIELGNGTVRSYLALVLAERKSVPVAVRRGEALVPLTFRLD